MTFYGMILFCVLVSNILSALRVAEPMSDVHLSVHSSFEKSIDTDMFENDEDATIYVSVTPNEWVTYSYENSVVQTDRNYGYFHSQRAIVEDGIAYVLDGDFGLRIFEINPDFSDFDYLGGYEVYYGGSDIAYLDGFCYISDRFEGSGIIYGIDIFDVQDPRNPILKSRISCCFDGTIKYLTAENIGEKVVLFVTEIWGDHEGLHLFDVSNPVSPKNLSFIAGEDFKNVAVKYLGGRYYVVIGTRNDGLVMYDIDDLSSPVETSWSEDESSLMSIAIYENFIFACSFNVFFIYDISDPYDIQEITVLDTDLTCIYAETNGKFVFTALYGNDGFSIIDVQDVMDPRVVYVSPEKYDGIFSVENIFVDQDNPNVIYVSAEERFVFVYDISQNVSEPAIISTWMQNLGDEAASIQLVDDRYLFVGDKGYYGGLRILDIVDPTIEPVCVGLYGFGETSIKGFAVDGNYLYVAEFDNDLLTILEMTYPNETSSRFHFNIISKMTVATPSSVSVNGNFTYVVTGYNDYLEDYFYVINTTDKVQPFQISTLSFWHSMESMSGIYETTFDGTGKYAFISDGNLGVELVDISNPKEPVVVSNIETDDSYQSVVLENGTYLVVADGEDGLRIVDIQNKESASVVGICNSKNALGVRVQGKHAIIADEIEGVKIMDISNVQSPLLVNSISENLYANDVEVKDNYIYVSDASHGVSIIRSDLKLEGTSNFQDFCGETEVEVCGSDVVNGKVCQTFKLSRDDYCNGHGTCIPDLQCDCFEGYEGDTCTIFSCFELEMNNQEVCSGRGLCDSPDECQCTGLYYGSKCEHDITSSFIIPSVASIFGIGLILLIIGASVVCCCILCLACCICLGVLMSGLCLMTCVVWRQFSTLKKFGQLKDFDLYLKEQELEEDTSVAHLSINKGLFEVDYDEIRLIKVVGEGGSHSVVYQAKWAGKDVAFKCFKTRDICGSQASFDEFEREVKILGSVAHPHILQFYGCSLKPPRVGIICEFCPKGDLLFYLCKAKEKGDDIDFGERLRICHEIILAMSYLHTRSIIHRDLKLENVLIDQSNSCKLMDFGLSRIVDHMSQVKTRRIGTQFYMAPEVVSGDYDEKIDVYAFGISCYIILTDRFKPYEGVASEADIAIEMRVAADPTFRPEVSFVKKIFPSQDVQWLMDIITDSWDHSPNKRPSFKDLDTMFQNWASGESSSTNKNDEDRNHHHIGVVDRSSRRKGKVPPPIPGRRGRNTSLLRDNNNEERMKMLEERNFMLEKQLDQGKKRLEKMEVEMNKLRSENLELRKQADEGMF